LAWRVCLRNPANSSIRHWSGMTPWTTSRRCV
jgi:hypothetical protein